MIYIGVDPGKKGGYAVIDAIGYPIVRPWNDRQFAHDMNLISSGMESKDMVAAVEKVASFSGQGVKSMFTFGTEYGFIQGVLNALEIPFQLVPPNVWKRSFSLIGKDKKASIETCQRLFPELSLLPTEKSKVPSDGLAEAALLAIYAKRHF